LTSNVKTCQIHLTDTNREEQIMTTDTVKKADPEDWHPADVIAALRKRGFTLTSLALQHGLSDSSSMSAALTRSHPKNEQRIADALELHPKDIWPSRYNKDGSRKPQGFRALQSTKSPCQSNGNVIKAA